MQRLSRLVLFAAVSLSALSAMSADAQGRGARRIDGDGDGRITLREFIAARGSMFERLDIDHDGKITKDELAAFQSRMEKADAGAEIRSGKERGEGGGARQFGRLAELSADGSITRAQWDAAMAKRFERLDTAHAGFITLDQMRGARRAAMASETPTTAAPPPPAPPK